MIWPVKIIMPIGEEQTVYEPEYRVKLGFVRCWVAMVAGIAQSRELIVQLFYRDMLAASKQSLLGIAWTWVSPLIGIASWLFLNQVGVLMPGKSDVPYPLFVLLGTTIWGVFMAVFTSAASSLSANSNLIMHAHFSHQVLVAQQVAQASLSMVANLVLLAAAFTFFGVHPQWTALFFPLSLVPLLLLGVGLGDGEGFAESGVVAVVVVVVMIVLANIAPLARLSKSRAALSVAPWTLANVDSCCCSCGTGQPARRWPASCVSMAIRSTRPAMYQVPMPCCAASRSILFCAMGQPGCRRRSCRASWAARR